MTRRVLRAPPTEGTRASRDIWLTVGLGITLAVLFQLYERLNHGPARWSLRTAVDDAIPLVVPMVVPYVSIYAIAAVTAVAFSSISVRLLQRALLAAILTLGASYLCYLVVQTSVARPDVLGDDPFSALLRTVYAVDQPYNAFPSLHVGLSVVMAVHWLWSGRRIGRWMAAWCALVACSTVFVHQHYLADVAGGIVVGGAASLTSRRILEGR